MKLFCIFNIYRIQLIGNSVSTGQIEFVFKSPCDYAYGHQSSWLLKRELQQCMQYTAVESHNHLGIQFVSFPRRQGVSSQLVSTRSLLFTEHTMVSKVVIKTFDVLEMLHVKIMEFQALDPVFVPLLNQEVLDLCFSVVICGL